MFDFFFHGFSAFELAMLIVSALLIGINKTGIPGLGLVPVLLLTLVFPTRLSTGLQLGMLCMADVAAVCWYRRNANWKLILRLIPAAAVGLAVGTLVVNHLDDFAMGKMIGGIVLFLCAVSLVRDLVLKGENGSRPTGRSERRRDFWRGSPRWWRMRPDRWRGCISWH